MVLTYTQAEAKAKAKAESRKRPIRRVQAGTEEQPVEKIKWKKERKRRRRRSHNPRIVLKSVEREAGGGQEGLGHSRLPWSAGDPGGPEAQAAEGQHSRNPAEAGGVSRGLFLV